MAVPSILTEKDFDDVAPAQAATVPQILNESDFDDVRNAAATNPSVSPAEKPESLASTVLHGIMNPNPLVYNIPLSSEQVKKVAPIAAAIAAPEALPEIGGIAGLAARLGAAGAARAGTSAAINQNLSRVPSEFREGAEGEALAATLGKAIPAVHNYLATSKIGGMINPSSWEFFKANPDAVLAKVGTPAEHGDSLVNDFRTAVSNASQKLEDAYRSTVNSLSSNATNPVRVNMTGVQDKIAQMANDEYGYLNPERNMDTSDAKFFQDKILGRLDKYRYSDATPKQVYELQKDLNGYLKDNIGTTLGSAIQKTKGIVSGFIQQEPSLAPIAEANQAWSNAKDVEALAHKAVSNNDPIGFIKRTFANPQETLNKGALEDLSARVPEAGQSIHDLRSFIASRDIQPWFRKMTGTGGETGIAAAALAGHYVPKVMENPALAALAPLAAGMSPRLYGLSYKGAQMAQKVAPEALRGLMSLGGQEVAQ